MKWFFLLSTTLLVFIAYTEVDALLLKDHQRLYAIGDLHGDLSAFKNAVAAVGLYSLTEQRWTGKDSNLVIIGDIVNQGPNSKELMDFIIDLEAEAKQHGGQIHSLLGNHELLITMGILDHTHPNDTFAYKTHPSQKGVDALLSAFQGDSKYARWIRSRKTIVQINQFTFVHAGIDEWVYKYSVEEINNLVRDWFLFHQGVGPEPNENTRWVIEGNGPLWTRRLVGSQNKSRKFNGQKADIAELLHALKSKAVVIGHSTIESIDQSLNHPEYPGQVIMLDTGISKSFGNIVSIFEFKQNGQITGLEISRGAPSITRSQSISKNLFLTIDIKPICKTVLIPR